MKYLLLTTTLMLAACTTPAPKPTVNLANIHNDTYITCQSDLGKQYELDYLKSQRADAPSTIFPSITVSTVTDIYGKVWSVNSQEWTQYTCTEKVLP